MAVYIGQTGSRILNHELRWHGFGEMTTRGKMLPPKRLPFAFDNGAFMDHSAGLPFQAAEFENALDKIHRLSLRPDFIVCPDIMLGGMASLDFSLQWVPYLRGLAPLYFVVQDGMMPEQIGPAMEPFAGIFVGGSVAWKTKTGKQWVHLAHALGRKCHIGRVGSARRVRWARAIGADSIDSCLPLWSADKLRVFCAALIHPQLDLL